MLFAADALKQEGVCMALRRKKTATLALIAALALFGIASAFVFPASALAWDNCPKGLVNDPYPGACRRYVDTNGDGICDLSQSKPAESTTTTVAAATTTTRPPESSTTTTLAVATTTAGEPPTGDCPLGPCAGCGACLSLGSATPSLVVADTNNDDSSVLLASLSDGSGSSGTGTGTWVEGSTTDAAAGTTDVAEAGSTVSETVKSSLLTQYNVSPIAIGFFLIYAVSFILYKTKKIKITVHRKIWNVLLLATFLITGLFGLILTIQLDYQLPFKIPFDILFWHVEAGVAMTLISFFHIAWHFNYYRNLLRSGSKKLKAARKAEREIERIPVAPQPRLVMESREERRMLRERKRRVQQREAREMRSGVPPRAELGTDV